MSRIVCVTLLLTCTASAGDFVITERETFSDRNQFVVTERFQLPLHRPEISKAPVSESDTEPEDTPKQRPPVQCVVFSQADKLCPPCKRFKDTEVPKLRKAGKTVDDTDKADVRILDIGSTEAKEFVTGLQLANQNGTPYFAYYHGGKFEKGYAGYTQAARILEDLTPKRAASISAVEVSDDEWQSVPETWPARVPLNGTNRPNKQAMLRHLRNHVSHNSEPWQAWPLESMTVGQLVTLHDEDHLPGTPQRTAVVKQQAAILNWRVLPVSRGSYCPDGKCPRR